MRKIHPNEKSTDLNMKFIAGRSTLNEKKWYSLRTDDWNLIGLLAGDGVVTIGPKRYVMQSGSFYLFSPMDVPRFFYTRHWDVFWIHVQLNQVPEWPRIGPGLCAVTPPDAVFRKMMRELQETVQIMLDQKYGWRPLAMSLLSTFLIRGSLLSERSGRFDSRIRQAVKILSDLQNTSSIDEIARICGMSRSLFFNVFRNAYGISPHVYRSKIRMEKACFLLESTELTIDEIAEQCAWKEKTVFFRQFKHSMGQTPLAYRNTYLDHLARSKR